MNKYVNLIAVAIIYTLLFNLPLFASEKKKSMSPEDTVVSFYKWYLGSLEKNIEPIDKNRKTLIKYVSKSLVVKIEKSLEDDELDADFLKSPDFYESLDADYFLKSQDILEDWTGNISTTPAVINGGVASTVVTLGATDETRWKLTVRLKKESNRWKIIAVQKGTHP